MADIKYRFSEDEKGNIVDIEDVTTEMRKNEKFFCLSCHNEMVAVIVTGNRARYFRHYENVNCDRESYLHRLAKKILKERFDNSQSFIVSLCRNNHCNLYDNCPNREEGLWKCISQKHEDFDLKKYYDQCILELKDTETGLKPDLMLKDSTGKQEPIWLEILVTHPCTREKLATGARIIEFIIKTEEDALALKNRYLQENVSYIKFYNFKKDSTIKDSTITAPYYRYQRAELLSTGFIRTRQFTCREKKDFLSQDAIASIELPKDLSNDAIIRVC